MTLLCDQSSTAGWDPPFVSARRRRVVGVDLLIEAPHGVTTAFVASIRAAIIHTPARLESHNGEPTSLTVQGRFIGRDDEGHLTDHAISHLLVALGDAKLRWSELVKLEEFDGIGFFAPVLPSSASEVMA